MKLLRIEHSPGYPLLVPISKDYWKLISDYTIRIHTDCGVMQLTLKPGWITDKRSGSSAFDWAIPKEGSMDQLALVCFHDGCYSGWVPRYLADDILYQGWLMTGIDDKISYCAYVTVRSVGWLGYYDLDDTMKHPYKLNRMYEHYWWKDK